MKISSNQHCGVCINYDKTCSRQAPIPEFHIWNVRETCECLPIIFTDLRFNAPPGDASSNDQASLWMVIPSPHVSTKDKRVTLCTPAQVEEKQRLDFATT